MIKKTLSFIFTIIIIVLALFAISYFLKQKDSNNEITINTEQEEQAGDLIVSAVETENSDLEVEQVQGKLVSDYFEINMPEGWIKTDPVAGALTMAINPNDKTNSAAANKIGFKSYFAVTHDTLKGEEDFNGYTERIKKELKDAIPSTKYTNEQTLVINGKTSDALEASLSQQEVDFKILMVLIKGDGKDVWAISYNTTSDNWDKYKEAFYETAESFKLKIL